MELSVKNLSQAAVTLSCTGDHASRCIQHTLQLVCRDLWRPGENCITVVLHTRSLTYCYQFGATENMELENGGAENC